MGNGLKTLRRLKVLPLKSPSAVVVIVPVPLVFPVSQIHYDKHYRDRYYKSYDYQRHFDPSTEKAPIFVFNYISNPGIMQKRVSRGV